MLRATVGLAVRHRKVCGRDCLFLDGLGTSVSKMSQSADAFALRLIRFSRLQSLVNGSIAQDTRKLATWHKLVPALISVELNRFCRPVAIVRGIEELQMSGIQIAKLSRCIFAFIIVLLRTLEQIGSQK